MAAYLAGRLGGREPRQDTRTSAPAEPLPAFEALVVRMGAETLRYTADSREYLVVQPPVELGAIISGTVERIQYYLGGDLVVTAPTAGLAPWHPTPGDSGELYALAWNGNVAVRSPVIRVRFPMPPTIICPDVVLAHPASPVEAADYGSFAVNDRDNVFLIDWLGSRYRVPLTADPLGCDESLARVLQTVQEQVGIKTRGMFAPVLDFARREHGSGVWVNQAWLIESEPERARLEVLVVAVAMDDRRFWCYQVELTRHDGRWVVKAFRQEASYQYLTCP